MRQEGSIVVAIVMVSCCSSSLAENSRWTWDVSGMGFASATVNSSTGAEFTIYCDTLDRADTPGLVIKNKTIFLKQDESTEIQVIIDNEHYRFVTKQETTPHNMRLEAIGKTEVETITRLSDYFIESKSNLFFVEWPKYNTKEAFTLLDARRSLQRPNGNVLDSCTKAKVVVKKIEPPEAIVAKIKSAVSEHLKDPESARFPGKLVAVDKSGVLHVCGMVNAKNSFGGYVGAKPFYAIGTNDRADVVAIGGTPTGDRAVHMMCAESGME